MKDDLFSREDMETQIDKPADFTSPEDLYKELVRAILRYHPSGDITIINKAYQIASKAHNGQKRKSGEDYIIHPICVSIILAELKSDKESIAAGLLHDVIEDTAFTYEEIRDMFGEEIAILVDGVTKLTQLPLKSDKVETQAENLRKLFLAMAKDIRVILIKLADRLHNMRTLQYQSPEKQKEKSRETLDIYSPIAQRLGISKVKVELDDLSLKYLEPDKYYDLVENIAIKKEARESFIREIMKNVKQHVEEGGIHCEVSGRVKHYFSIYKKMVSQNKTLDEIYDLFAIRVIVHTPMECYAVLGVIHDLYLPVPGRMKDYIAMPKLNHYQSLHTTVMSQHGLHFEVQIRTYDMHQIAEYGIAAHWKYKEKGTGSIATEDETKKMIWLREILEWQRGTTNNKEYLNMVKGELNLFADNVFVFTPEGEVLNLPSGATPIDFAYMIHSAVGNKMVGARVNGKLVPIDYQLKNGDQVEIVTSQNSKGPSMDWLKIVKSNQARAKINQWFKSVLKEDNIQKGKELLEKYCKLKGINWIDINKPEYQQKVVRRYALKEWDAVLAAVGHGGLKEGQVVNKMAEERAKNLKKEQTDAQILEQLHGESPELKIERTRGGIVVKGLHDSTARFSKCCLPVPGDEIVAFTTRGRGYSIHRTDCINILNLSEAERVRLSPAQWQLSESEGKETYAAELTVTAIDKVGMLADILGVFKEKEISVHIKHTGERKGVGTVVLICNIRGIEQLNSLIRKLRQLNGVIDIERTTS